MSQSLSSLDAQRRYSLFALEEIAPFASAADKSGAFNISALHALIKNQFLGSLLATRYGGAELDQLSYGELMAQVGAVCSATRTLMTVHDMVSAAVTRWGSEELKNRYLPEFARGSKIGAFALSESEAGSDVSRLSLTLTRSNSQLVVSGEKCWVSFGQSADVFLVFGRSSEGPTAFLVPGDSEGLTRVPITTMVGVRAGMMANLIFTECRIPDCNIVGRPGFGLSHVASIALDQGRYSVAWGALGIAEAAFRASHRYSQSRSLSGRRLIELPLMRGRLTRMGAAVRAARQLCTEAGRLRLEAAPSAAVETTFAKYFSSKTAVSVANEAIQIYGARGLSEEHAVERLLRDAKTTEMIEGSSDALEILLGECDLPDRGL